MQPHPKNGLVFYCLMFIPSKWKIPLPQNKLFFLRVEVYKEDGIKHQKKGYHEIVYSNSHGKWNIRLPTCTLPETNIAPENRPFPKETSIPTIHFQVGLLVSGRVVPILQRWISAMNPTQDRLTVATLLQVRDILRVRGTCKTDLAPWTKSSLQKIPMVVENLQCEETGLEFIKH